MHGMVLLSSGKKVNRLILYRYHQLIPLPSIPSFSLSPLTYQVNSADELVLTELVLDNFFSDYSAEEIAALLSCFTFQDKTDVELRLTERLEKVSFCILIYLP